MTVEPEMSIPVPNVYTGSNLLTMSPRKWTDRDRVNKDNVQLVPGDTVESGTKIYSCAFYAWPNPSDPSNSPIELTIKLDYPYLVDALFYAGDPAKITYDKMFLAGPFQVFVGWSSDYTQNPSCTVQTTGSWNGGCTRDPFCQPGGEELFCGLVGQYVTLVRYWENYRVVVDEQEMTGICAFGVVSDLDSRVTVLADSLASHYSIVRGEFLVLNGELVNPVGSVPILSILR